MKHLIKKAKDIAHGTISWSHKGKDGQYCEAGELVFIDWQPDAKWGLVEAHYIDGDGKQIAIDLKSKAFAMPNSEIIIGGTFKRFVLPDWTGDQENAENNVLDWLTAGDITPKSDAPIETDGSFAAQTTGGDMDIKNGAAQLLSIKGNLDSQLNPFIADEMVSTGMNLVDPTAVLDWAAGGKMYFFPVVAGMWGEYGTTQENNGYIVIGGSVRDNEVYFADQKPTNASTAHSQYSTCPYHDENGVRYYLPPTNGWLCLFVYDEDEPTEVPACHIVWSNKYDLVRGEFGNDRIDLSGVVTGVHAWGMAGIVTAGRSVFDEVDFVSKKLIKRIDRADLSSLTWAMATTTTDDGNIYTFTATVSAMAANGLSKIGYEGIEITGNVLSFVSSDISTVNAFKAAVEGSFIYYELATYVETSVPTLDGSFEANDFGLTYFMYGGELVSVPAYVSGAYQQGGKDQLFNAVTYQAILAEVVATALCQLDARVKALEQRTDIVCDNLTVRRFADTMGWRLVDAAPASATSAGRMGDYYIAASILYICVSDNTWKKITIGNF